MSLNGELVVHDRPAAVFAATTVRRAGGRAGTIFAVAVALAVAANAFGGPADAAIPIRTMVQQQGGRPLPQQQVRALPPAQTWHAVRPGPHVFYGTIVAIKGNVLTLRLRNGRAVNVDATAAIANGDYSAPLFVGKIVSIDGNQVGAAFTASHVFRMSNLANLPADR